MYRALLHKRGPLLLSNPRWKLPYYTTPVIFPRWRLCYYTTPVIFPRWRLPYYTTPTNLPHMEITLLHQIYLGQTDPPQTGPTQLMETRCTGPYYTKEALSCLSTPDGDYPTTPPLLFSPDGDYPTTPPLLIYPRWKLPYYTTPANLPQMEIILLHHSSSFTRDGDYPTTPDIPLADRPPTNRPYPANEV